MKQDNKKDLEFIQEVIKLMIENKVDYIEYKELKIGKTIHQPTEIVEQSDDKGIETQEDILFHSSI